MVHMPPQYYVLRRAYVRSAEWEQCAGVMDMSAGPVFGVDHVPCTYNMYIDNREMGRANKKFLV